MVCAILSCFAQVTILDRKTQDRAKRSARPSPEGDSLLRRPPFPSQTTGPTKSMLAVASFVLLLVAMAKPTLAANSGPSVGKSASAGTVASAPLESQTPPDMNVRPDAARQLEYHDTVRWLPSVLLKQWSTSEQIPPESFISERYAATFDHEARSLSLKQAIYLALKNNPSIKAASLDPVATMEGVKMAVGTFDPDFIAVGSDVYTITPIGSALVTFPFSLGLKNHQYQWNFSVNKLLASTNGVLSLIFQNTNVHTNLFFQDVNPSYAPTITVSLAQPLLRYFGWNIATINVQLAESAQKRSQLNYAQKLNDFVQQVANDYWSVVAAEQSLEVERAALKFYRDLVRVNAISVKVGTLAPIDLREAQAAAMTAEANVAAAEATLTTTRASLRQDVMLNPRGTFVPETIEPSDRPNLSEPLAAEEETSLESAVAYLPSLAALRQAIRNAQIEASYMENELLSLFTLGSQLSLTSFAGGALCKPNISRTAPHNCEVLGQNGFALFNFDGGYATALNKLFGFAYYSFSFFAQFELPIDNAPVKATLGQYRANYEQLRMQYRAALSQVITGVETALANLEAARGSVKAAQAATAYAREALREEQVSFRVGLATTHDLLQYESALVNAQGQQIGAEVNLENAKIALRHADGLLLQHFNIRFRVQSPHLEPWYERF